MLTAIKNKFEDCKNFSLVISGSAGMGMSENCGVEFVQEVYAEKVAAEKNIPNSDVVYHVGYLLALIAIVFCVVRGLPVVIEAKAVLSDEQ